MALNRISEEAAATLEAGTSALSAAAAAMVSAAAGGASAAALVDEIVTTPSRGVGVGSPPPRPSAPTPGPAPSSSSSPYTPPPSASRSHRHAPDLYRAALNRRWSTVISRSTTHPEEARYVRPCDGLSALHLAVMSRVLPTSETYGRKRGGGGGVADGGPLPPSSVGGGGGRIRSSHGAEVPGLSSSRIKCPAPFDAVRSLLVAWPDGASQRCTVNGYTPLAYACLVAPPAGDGDDPDEVTISSAYSARSRSTVYASLYRDSYGILEEAEKLVRLLLRHRPEATSVLTLDGLSPLDVHIVSYSVGWGAEEDENDAAGGAGAGRTTSGVLRTLLESDPSLARSRPRREGSVETVGPLELLYKYNARGFLSTLAREGENVKAGPASGGGSAVVPGVGGGGPAAASSSTVSQRNRAGKAWFEERDDRSPRKRNSETSDAQGDADGTGGGRPRSRSVQRYNSARCTLSSWWVWKWSILLLKYLHHRRGRKFQAVHAASSVPGVPLPLLMLAVRAFPNQIREADEYRGGGDLPLHIVAGWGRPVSDPGDARAAAAAAAAADPITASRKGMVLSELLTEYPEAAGVLNNDGKTPLCLALEAGATWHAGVRRLVRAYPPALRIRDSATRLMPFMIAALGRSGCDDLDGGEVDDSAWKSGRGGTGGGFPHHRDGTPADRDAEDRKRVQNVYELLRSDPTALGRFVPGWEGASLEEAGGGGKKRRGGGGRRKSRRMSAKSVYSRASLVSRRSRRKASRDI